MSYAYGQLCSKTHSLMHHTNWFTNSKAQDVSAELFRKKNRKWGREGACKYVVSCEYFKTNPIMSVFGLLILPEEKTTKNEEMYWYEYYLVNIEHVGQIVGTKTLGYHLFANKTKWVQFRSYCNIKYVWVHTEKIRLFCPQNKFLPTGSILDRNKCFTHHYMLNVVNEI